MKNEQRISKPNNQPTSILMELLQWLTNLELSGSSGGEQDIGNLKPVPIIESSLKRGKEMKDQNVKKFEMNIKSQLLKGFALLLLLVTFTITANAQTSTTPTQEVCPGTEPYKVIPGNPTDLLQWSILGGVSGTDWTISSPNTAATDIIWVTPGTYIVTFRETDTSTSTNCFDEKVLTVTVNPAPVLAITNPLPVCFPNTVDLTAAAVSAGSTLPAGTILTYWTDAAGTVTLTTASAVATSGTYYIKAETAAGCSDIKPVTVTVDPTPVLAISNPAPVCFPGTIDLTAAVVTAGSTLPVGTILTYWTDAAGTVTLTTASAVATSGTYYIKAETAAGCSDIKPVTVTVDPTPVLAITNPSPVCFPNTVDLTAAAVTAGSTLPVGTILTYWTDAAGTVTLTTASAVATSGTYYIKAETAAGCSDIKPVTVTVDPTPVLAITNPVPVCSPGTIDLTAAAVTAGSTLPVGTILTYWTDAAGTVTLTTASAVATSGTYYIKAETAAGCSDIKPVTVTVDPTPVLAITNPSPVCFPSTVDLTAAAVTAGSTLPVGTILTYWTDAAGTVTLTTASAVATSGTYYIKAETAAGCSDIKPVTVTVDPTPVLAITNPTPVCSPGTIDLTAAAVTAGSTLPAGTILTYWTDAAGTVTLTTASAVATSGTYYIKAETAAGCSDIKPVTVTIDPTPVLAITNPAPVCSPGTIDLTAAAVTAGSTLPAGTILTYWTDAAGTVTLTTASAVATSGTYYIKATTTAGCSDIKAVDVTVNPLPDPTITGPSPICETTAGNIYTTETGMTNYIWAISGGGTKTSGGATTDNTVTVTWNTAGAQTVSVTYTNANGCTATKVINITVNPLPNTSPIYHN